MTGVAISLEEFDGKSTIGRSAESMLPLVVVVLLGFSLQVTIEGVWLSVTPAYLLPIVAVWWAQRVGSRVAVTLALFSLMPDLAWRLFDVVTVYYGFSDVTCMLAAGAALAFAKDSRPETLSAVVPRGRRWLLIGSLAFWIFAGTERGNWSSRAEGLSISVDVLAVPAIVGVALAIDWRRAFAALGRSQAKITSALAILAGVSLVLRANSSVGPLSAGIGSAGASALVPALCFVTVLCGWASSLRMVVAVTAAAAVSMTLALTAGPLSQWAMGARPMGTPAILFVHACAASLMGTVFHGLRDRGAAGSAAAVTQLGQREAVALVAAILLIVLLPAINRGEVAFWGTAVWVLAGASLLAGRSWGDRAIVATPLAIIAGVTGLCLLVDPERNFQAVRSDLPTLLAVTTTYALVGWLWMRQGRIRKTVTTEMDSALGMLDLSAVARVVQTIDNAATLRAFWALLVPALAAAQLVGLGIFVDLGRDLFDGDPMPWIWASVVGALIALWPALFVLVDWADRQDSLRALSGVTGGLLALLGTGLLAMAPAFALPALLQEAPAAARFIVAGILLAGLPAIGFWLQMRPAAARRSAIVAAGLALLALVAAAAALILPIPRPERLEATAQAVATAGAIAVLMAAWVRAIRLRLVLCEDRPRQLLYGALPPRHFWIRMAALLGLPSTLWRGSALGEPATWAFLLSRPIVYAGTIFANTSVLLGAGVVAAGHAAFYGAKRLSARAVWRPQESVDTRAPVLFLRSFEDDQCDFERPLWQVRLRWFDLWSFRRNVDEAMVDEVAQYGPVVALGRPGQADTPFGALRHYSSHEEWKEVVIQTARRARAIVLVAGRAPGLRWEFEMLRTERLLDRTILLLHPDPARVASNGQAIEWLLGPESPANPRSSACIDRAIAVLPTSEGPRLLTADKPSAAAYLVALRAHLQQIDPGRLTSSLS